MFVLLFLYVCVLCLLLFSFSFYSVVFIDISICFYFFRYRIGSKYSSVVKNLDLQLCGLMFGPRAQRFEEVSVF